MRKILSFVLVVLSYLFISLTYTVPQAHAAALDECYQPYEVERKSRSANYEFLIKPCLKYAEKGEAQAQHIVGIFYAYGLGTEQNITLAASWFQQAVSQKYIPSYYYLGMLYVEGQGVEHDYTKALDLFQRGANANDSQSMYALSQMFGNGHGMSTPNQAEYVKWLTKSAQAGEKQAAFELGTLYFTGMVLKQDYKEALNLFQQASRADYPPAQFSLGYMYLKGIATEQSNRLAIDLITKAAKSNYPVAQYQLGYLYENGIAVNQNPSAAKLWYSWACNNKVEEACISFQLLTGQEPSAN